MDQFRPTGRQRPASWSMLHGEQPVGHVGLNRSKMDQVLDGTIVPVRVYNLRYLNFHTIDGMTRYKLTSIFFTNWKNCFCDSFGDKNHGPHSHPKFCFCYIQFNLRHGIEHNHQLDSTNAQNLKSKFIFDKNIRTRVSTKSWTSMRSSVRS